MSNNRRAPYLQVEGGPSPSTAYISQVCQSMGAGVNDVWTATQFKAPKNSSGVELTPHEVFQEATTDLSDPELAIQRLCIRPRFAPSVSPARTMFIYTDGACLDNGSDVIEPRGGVAFVLGDGRGGRVGFALENQGADDQFHRHTSNRAELRAVTAALAFRVWPHEGWERVVIVTDSEYVANHATVSLRRWASRGWRLASGNQVANIDLWQELSHIMGSYAEQGCEVSFWRVPRRLNVVADQFAKEMAATGDIPDEYIKCFCLDRPDSVIFY